MPSAKVMFTARPTRNTGMARARLGPIRWRISLPMSRLSSARPKSKGKSLSGFSGEELQRFLVEDGFCKGFLLRIPKQRLVVAALGLPFLDRLGRHALLAELH